MKLLSVILNLTAATGYLKNPLYQSTTFQSVLNTFTNYYMYPVAIIFLAGVILFSIVQIVTGTNDKKAIKRLEISFIGFTVLMGQLLLEKTLIHFNYSGNEKILAAGVALLILVAVLIVWNKRKTGSPI